jgi:hypothetical protein
MSGLNLFIFITNCWSFLHLVDSWSTFDEYCKKCLQLAVATFGTTGGSHSREEKVSFILHFKVPWYHVCNDVVSQILSNCGLRDVVTCWIQILSLILTSFKHIWSWYSTIRVVPTGNQIVRWDCDLPECLVTFQALSTPQRSFGTEACALTQRGLDCYTKFAKNFDQLLRLGSLSWDEVSRCFAWTLDAV